MAEKLVTVFDPQTQEVKQVAPAEAQAGFLAGKLQFPTDAKFNVVDAEGNVGNAATPDLSRALRGGYRLADDHDVNAFKARDQGVRAGLEAAAGALTLGGSDAVLQQIGTEGLAERRETPAGTIGSVLGNAAMMIPMGGVGGATEALGASASRNLASKAAMAALAPVRAVEAAGAAVEAAASKGLQGVLKNEVASKILASGAARATEFGAFSAGGALSEEALGNPDANVADLAAAAGHGLMQGAALGAPLGLAMGGIGAALEGRAARKAARPTAAKPFTYGSGDEMVAGIEAAEGGQLSHEAAATIKDQAFSLINKASGAAMGGAAKDLNTVNSQVAQQIYQKGRQAVDEASRGLKEAVDHVAATSGATDELAQATKATTVKRLLKEDAANDDVAFSSGILSRADEVLTGVQKDLAAVREASGYEGMGAAGATKVTGDIDTAVEAIKDRIFKSAGVEREFQEVRQVPNPKYVSPENMPPPEMRQIKNPNYVKPKKVKASAVVEDAQPLRKIQQETPDQAASIEASADQEANDVYDRAEKHERDLAKSWIHNHEQVMKNPDQLQALESYATKAAQTAEPRTLYRGLRDLPADSEILNGGEIAADRLTSWSAQKTAADKFSSGEASKAGAKAGTQSATLVLDNGKGLMLGSSESESLLGPQKFRVVGRERVSPTHTIVHVAPVEERAFTASKQAAKGESVLGPSEPEFIDVPVKSRKKATPVEPEFIETKQTRRLELKDLAERYKLSDDMAAEIHGHMDHLRGVLERPAKLGEVIDDQARAALQDSFQKIHGRVAEHVSSAEVYGRAGEFQGELAAAAKGRREAADLLKSKLKFGADGKVDSSALQQFVKRMEKPAADDAVKALQSWHAANGDFARTVDKYSAGTRTVAAADKAAEHFSKVYKQLNGEVQAWNAMDRLLLRAREQNSGGGTFGAAAQGVNLALGALGYSVAGPLGAIAGHTAGAALSEMVMNPGRAALLRSQLSAATSKIVPEIEAKVRRLAEAVTPSKQTVSKGLALGTTAMLNARSAKERREAFVARRNEILAMGDPQRLSDHLTAATRAYGDALPAHRAAVIANVASRTSALVNALPAPRAGSQGTVFDPQTEPMPSDADIQKFAETDRVLQDPMSVLDSGLRRGYVLAHEIQALEASGNMATRIRAQIMETASSGVKMSPVFRRVASQIMTGHSVEYAKISAYQAVHATAQAQSAAPARSATPKPKVTAAQAQMSPTANLDTYPMLPR